MPFEYAQPPFPLSSHTVLGTALLPPFPDGLQTAVFGMGCFWGAERKFWVEQGVHSTAAGYLGGQPDNPGYRQVCQGNTGHAEVVLVVYTPEQVDYATLLRIFWESHDPTQGMRQGNDIGSEYRSVIFTYGSSQAQVATESAQLYQQQLIQQGHKGVITTQISAAPCFSYAEPVHQQYLDKNPAGYCGLGGTGVCFPPED